MKMMQQGDAPLTGVCFFLHLMRRNQAVSHERPSDYPSQVSARTRIWKCVCRVSATLPKKKKKKMYVFFFFPKLFLKTKSILHLGWDNIWEWGANYHTPFDLCCMQCPNFIWIGVGLVRCRFFAAYRALPLNQEEFGGTDTKTRGD